MTVYLDHAATTPLLPEAREAMVDALDVVGNPSSIHTAGQRAKQLWEESREVLADHFRVTPAEVIFTSGGTESINLAIKGLFWAATPSAKRILVPRAEHHATLDTVAWLEASQGAVIEWLPVDEHGALRLDALEEALAAPGDIALLTLLAANNEVGTIQPVAEAAGLARASAVPVHLDAVGAVGSMPIDFAGWGLAALSVSAHKLGGPLGAGALILARDARSVALVHGGGQQRGLRSGTADVPAAAGFAAALTTAKPDVTPLRDRLIAGVQAAVPEAVLSGDPVQRLPGNAHFTFPDAQGDSLLFLLDSAGLAVSTGSACQAGVPEASHVLLAMGLDEAHARSPLRFTLGWSSTEEEVDALLAALPDAYARARTAGLSSRPPR